MNDDSHKQLEPLTGSREIEQFAPERYRLRDCAYDFAIEEAKRLKNWPELEQAVDTKIEDQVKFYAWWKGELTDEGGRPSGTEPRPRFGLSLREAERLTGMKQQRVSDLGKRLANKEKYRKRLLGAAYHAALLEPVDNFRAKGTGNNEWCTPEKDLELARAVLGEFDIDPASNDEAQKRVRAKKYFTKETDGLQHEWRGRVWLNPPYATELIPLFISKLLEERLAGNVTAAIVLTHNYTDVKWFRELKSVADAICFTYGRVHFYELDEDGNKDIASCSQGQAFTYIGNDVERFANVFEGQERGFVMISYRRTGNGGA